MYSIPQYTDLTYILRHLSYVCLSVRPSVNPSIRPSVVNTIASERKELRTPHFANRPLLAIGRSVLKMDYIGLQDLVPPI